MAAQVCERRSHGGARDGHARKISYPVAVHREGDDSDHQDGAAERPRPLRRRPTRHAFVRLLLLICFLFFLSKPGRHRFPFQSVLNTPGRLILAWSAQFVRHCSVRSLILGSAGTQAPKTWARGGRRRVETRACWRARARSRPTPQGRYGILGRAVAEWLPRCQRAGAGGGRIVVEQNGGRGTRGRSGCTSRGAGCAGAVGAICTRFSVGWHAPGRPRRRVRTPVRMDIAFFVPLLGAGGLRRGLTCRRTRRRACVRASEHARTHAPTHTPLHRCAGVCGAWS